MMNDEDVGGLFISSQNVINRLNSLRLIYLRSYYAKLLLSFATYILCKW